MEYAIETRKSEAAGNLQKMASMLVDVLGKTPTAYVTGVSSVKTVGRWSSGQVGKVRESAVENRLLNTYMVVEFLQNYEADETIKAFMFGMNPGLDDDSPIKRLAKGEFQEVMKAAKALVADSY